MAGWLFSSALRQRPQRRARSAARRPLAESHRGVPALPCQSGLGCGEPGDRYPERRAGNIIETNRLAEADRRRVAAMLAANAELQPRTGRAPALGGDAYELSDPVDIECDKRVVLEDPEPLIGPGKARRVIARQAKDGLSEVVGAKAEELGALRDFAGAQCRPRQ